tara:strand:+ start:856 stop:1014 length:159 start_codon:yes stop_codon:yes gene_type:complete
MERARARESKGKERCIEISLYRHINKCIRIRDSQKGMVSSVKLKSKSDERER